VSDTLLLNGDCIETMRGFDAGSIDAVVCDPPYHLTSIVERFGKPDAAPSVVPEGGSGVYARSSRGFMGQTWDGGDIAFRAETWREVWRVLKPGGYLLAFSGTRTYHRMAVAIEDAGFEIRDCIGWHYGSGFPKSLDVSKAIDRAAPATDAARTWEGWGTALKPAWEPIVVARKPLEGTVAGNVLKYGTGAMNIDGCRVPHGGDVDMDAVQRQQNHAGNVDFGAGGLIGKEIATYKEGGRWPANVILSHAPDCGEDGCAPGCPCAALDAQSLAGGMHGAGQARGGGLATQASRSMFFGDKQSATNGTRFGDTGGASRFFNQLPIEADDLVPFIYAPKAARREREEGCDDLPARTGAEAVERAEGAASLRSPRTGAGRTASEVRNNHPCVKPVSVMRHLVRLVTPPGGLVLDPFMGSGTTGIAAVREGFDFVGIEMSPEYLSIAEARIEHAKAKG
jgi:site-specific DNA-methyltransferase (adenine-specific)